MLQKNILITGANGQVGKVFRKLAAQFNNYNFIFTAKKEADITDAVAIEKLFQQQQIDYCVNCAAYTAVDKAETDRDVAFVINATAPGILADVCLRNHTKLIHLSTDYVFNGATSIPYREDDTAGPINVYGASKLEGEMNVLQKSRDAIIIRTSWVYAAEGKNFVNTMLRLMESQQTLSIVADQLGSPTYATDLAVAIMSIILKKENWKSGLYHYCNEGIISWFDFALEIKKLIKSNCDLKPQKTIDYPTPAARPAWSVLDTTKMRETFNISIPHWKESLQACLIESGKILR